MHRERFVGTRRSLSVLFCVYCISFVCSVHCFAKPTKSFLEAIAIFGDRALNLEGPLTANAKQPLMWTVHQNKKYCHLDKFNNASTSS